MDTRQLRKEFSVFIVDSEPSVGSSLTETVQAIGYEDTRLFTTMEAAIEAARENPPHLVLFDYESFESMAVNGLTELQAVSSEILVLLMVSHVQALSALQMINRNLAYDSLVRPFISTLELAQKMDRGLVRLYYQFENEQLRERLEQFDRAKATGEAVRHVGPARQADSVDESFSDCLARMSASKDLDQTIQILLDVLSRQLRNAPILYFKYIPSHMSLMVAQSAWVPMDRFRGVGVDLKKEDPTKLNELFASPEKLEPLRSLIAEVFRHDQFTAFAHMNESDVLGLFVILDPVHSPEERTRVMALRRIFDLAYKRNLTLKEKHVLDITDALTGLYNRRHFSTRLDEEISRARRIMLPLTVITFDVDRFQTLNEAVGFQQADFVLKTLGSIIKKTTRANDIIARTGPDEFTCLLPHTPHIGGAVKAERLRRMIESARFPLLEERKMGPLTVSCGVSEYPSFSNDAEGLIRSADEALLQVRDGGGNRVCLASAPPGFQIDFIAREVVSGPPLAGHRRDDS